MTAAIVTPDVSVHTPIELTSINTIRTLAMDAVQAANSVEEASDFGWTKYTGNDGAIIGIETFGASAPLKQLSKKFGFTADHIVAAAKDQILRHSARK